MTTRPSARATLERMHNPFAFLSRIDTHHTVPPVLAEWFTERALGDDVVGAPPRWFPVEIPD